MQYSDPMKAWLWLALVAACAEPAPPLPAPMVPEPQHAPTATATLTAPPPATPPPTGAACALDDAWLLQLGNGRPAQSLVMRFDQMRKRGDFGPVGPITTYNDFGPVIRTGEEKYEWPEQDATEHGYANVVVLRNASGAVPSGYGPPTRLASGVLEHPPGKPAVEFIKRRFSLFVFPDGTWVRTDTQFTNAFRKAFAEPGKAPPPPSAYSDVAWEICGPMDHEMDPNELSLPWDVWAIEGTRGTVRLFGSRPEGELVYPFATPELAAQAAKEQSARCQKSGCPWMVSSSVEGPLVRYGIRVKTPPTAGRTVLAIAEKNRGLAAPPANASTAPGTPASGVYQRFYEVKRDTCPTHLAGKPFPSWMNPVMVTHRGGKPFANLESADPRAPGVMTGGPNDVELRQGSVTKRDITHLCPPYKIARTMTVLTATGDTIRTSEVTDHIGTTRGCAHTDLPDNCTTEVISTYILARKSCDGVCDAKLNVPLTQSGENDPAPRLNVSCTCP